MQLVAYGAQDIYLTGNPSITFWKIVYRRHTQFSLESIEQTFNGAVDWGKKVSVTVSRNGDLVSTMWLEIKLKKAATGETYYPAEAFVKEIELELGGQRIDKVYSDWYRIYDELFRSSDEKAAYRRLTDFDSPADDSQPTKRFYLPLIFSFNRHAGLALPLIALQVRMTMSLQSRRTLYRSFKTLISNLARLFSLSAVPRAEAPLHFRVSSGNWHHHCQHHPSGDSLLHLRVLGHRRAPKVRIIR